jgi:hypothetical protein
MYEYKMAKQQQKQQQKKKEGGKRHTRRSHKAVRKTRRVHRK